MDLCIVLNFLNKLKLEIYQKTWYHTYKSKGLYVTGARGLPRGSI